MAIKGLNIVSAFDGVGSRRRKALPATAVYYDAKCLGENNNEVDSMDLLWVVSL